MSKLVEEEVEALKQIASFHTASISYVGFKCVYLADPKVHNGELCIPGRRWYVFDTYDYVAKFYSEMVYKAFVPEMYIFVDRRGKIYVESPKPIPVELCQCPEQKMR